MSSLESAALLLGLGAVVQAALMLSANSANQKSDLGIMLIILAGAGITGFFVSFFGNGKYTLDGHVVATLFFFAVGFLIAFRKTFLPRINEQTLLIWNLIFLYIYFTQFPQIPFVTIVIILLGFSALVNALSPLTPSDIGRSLFYIWFSVMMTAIAISQIVFSSLKYIVFVGVPAELNTIDLFLGGMAFFYAGINALWIFQFIPLKGKGISWEVRKKQLRKDFEIARSKYEPTQFSPAKTFLILFIVGGALSINYIFHVIPAWPLINTLIIATPLFAFDKSSPGKIAGL